MANHCVYERCPDCGAEWCLRGCGYQEQCTCSAETIEARAKKKRRELEEAEQKIAESFPDGWF